MTISVDGVDNHLSYLTPKHCLTTAWAMKGQQTDAGRVALTFFNHGPIPFITRIFERLVINSDFDKTLSGNVKESGVNAVRIVRVYRRSDGQFVGEAESDGSGNYSFSGLVTGEQYTVIAFDDAGGADFNAMVLDKVEPV